MPGSTPATSQLDWGNDCAILVQGDEGPAQVIQLGHNGTPSVICQRRWCHLLVACPVPSLSPTRDALDFETVFPLYDGSISRKGSVRALPGLRVIPWIEFPILDWLARTNVH